MAGDWLKVERSTPDKEEVWRLANDLDLDPDAAFGKLFRVWSWFDEHTQNGNAATVTKKLLDRLVGVTGFCDAMISVNWMVEKDSEISLPNFDRHNGKTAKTRAVTNRRVAKSRKGKAICNDVGVTKTEQKPLPEKRREEKKVKDKTNDQDKLDQHFENFWKFFPKDLGSKGSKANARKEFHKLKPPDDLITLMRNRLTAQAERKRELKAVGQFAENFKHVERWIKYRQWDDDLHPPPTGGANATHQQPSQPGRPSAVDRVRIANEKRAAERAARRNAGRAVGDTDGDVWSQTGESVRGDDAGDVGEIIDGCFTRTDRSRGGQPH